MTVSLESHPDMPLTGAAPIDIMALNQKTCRWPVRENPWSDAGPWLYCGHDVTHGVYCRKHGALAYRESGLGASSATPKAAT
ncbi:GcrA family cell cycle regulator [uncultured Devosia sp.]|uniref:GcrA family cell cycle regulator n=1 Tax=uncultured Devosia sp. TaxID=211434 RepID=UPI0035CB1138